MGRILVGFDGSPPSRRALDVASARAALSGDQLVLVTVIPAQVRASTLSDLVPAALDLPPEMRRTFEENARARLDELAAGLKAAGASVRAEVRVGRAGEALLAVAQELGVQEIVLGHKAFESPTHRLGPNAEHVLRHAKVPVTVVP